jgi:hypothetical protein
MNGIANTFLIPYVARTGVKPSVHDKNLHPIIRRDRLPFNSTGTKSGLDRRIRELADD